MMFHIIMASHNRRNLTVRSIQRAAESAERAGISATFTVYDDGSIDGTADAVRELKLPVSVIEGDGSAYWAKSMSIAEQAVMRTARAEDWVVWMNDDVHLDLNAFERVREQVNRQPDGVFVASFKEPGGDSISYGGYRRYGRLHPLHCRLVEPADQSIPIDTMNGNLVFIPVSVVRRIGGIDGAFAHAAADTDFGLRCVERGVPLWLLPGTSGSCPRNPPTVGTVAQRWRAFTGVKGGGHPTTLKRLLQFHAKTAWPLLWMNTYLLWWARQLTLGLRASSSPAKTSA
jgi:GT2 family glycosyltransferase